MLFHDVMMGAIGVIITSIMYTIGDVLHARKVYKCSLDNAVEEIISDSHRYDL